MYRSQPQCPPVNTHQAFRRAHQRSFHLPAQTTAGDKDAKLIGLKSEYAKALWKCQEKTWLPQAAHDQATYLVDLIDHHLKGRYRWFRPISHLVRRKED
jgi:hypothetical protein